MSAAFTPGPWSITATVHCDRKNIFALGQPARMVGTFVSGSKSKLDQFDADARLIAAAPDMHEQLTEWLFLLDSGQITGNGLHAFAEKTRAILAKVPS